MCSAVRISGSSPSKRTSTTAPMTWVIVPILFLAMSPKFPCGPSQRLGARDDLDQLLGDGRLTRAVVVEGEAIDHLSGIAGGTVHRRHPRTLLARRVLEQCRIDLHRQVLRQQLREDFFFGGFEFVDRTRQSDLLAVGRRLKRNQLVCGHDLGHRRAKAVVDDRRYLQSARLIENEDALGDVAGLIEGYLTTTDLG